LTNTQKKDAANPYEKLADLPNYPTDGMSSQKTVIFMHRLKNVETPVISMGVVSQTFIRF
jgi:hypothetical protein